MKLHQLCLAALLVLAPVVSRAQVISPVTATTNMGSFFPDSLPNTLNGTGLIENTITSLHTATFPDNSWASSQGVVTGLITFDLGALYTVDDLFFWNQNAGGPGLAGITGLRNVDIQTSTDGSAFTSLLLTPTTFLQETGLTSSPQAVAIDRTATHVRFNVLSNWGDTVFSGFAEVKFTGERVNGGVPGVPDNGSTLALFGATLLGLASLRRRMNRR